MRRQDFSQSPTSAHIRRERAFGKWPGGFSCCTLRCNMHNGLCPSVKSLQGVWVFFCHDTDNYGKKVRFLNIYLRDLQKGI